MVGRGGRFGVVRGGRSTLAAGVTVMGTTGGERAFAALWTNGRDGQEAGIVSGEVQYSVPVALKATPRPL